MSPNPIVIHPDEAPIIAQCTPRGSGAIALLRISGSGAIAIASAMSKLAAGACLADQATHTIHYGWVVDPAGAMVDQVMFLLMRAPKTFTGQDTVEITCHNNPFIVENIIQQALSLGARMAQEGEFTKRAYLNKKIDLVQAEAIHELIQANTQQALKLSLAQLEGSFSHWVNKLEDYLYKALALSEASFEFLDEEMEFGSQIRELIANTLRSIDVIKKNFDQQQHIRQGIRIALIGSVNAGKSSLFNALLNKERAIVTPIAGTTRDVIEAGSYKQDNYWTLIDTAGLRNTNDIIEQEGIKRSLHEAHAADVVLLVYDSGRSMTPSELAAYTTILDKHHNKTIVIRNKIDLPSSASLVVPATILEVAISSTQKQNIAAVETAISTKIDRIMNSADSPFLLNQRQFNLVINLEKKLTTIQTLLTEHIQYEIVSYHLQEALEYLAELTGKSISEQGMDRVFREFCVGK